MPSPQRLPLFIVLILFALSRIFPVDSAYLKSRCGFQSQNYTIKWAFEPQTQNVVFVLKAKLPGEESGLKMEGKNGEGKQLITGIGFGNENELDFIGILSINDQLDLVSGHIEGGEQNGGGNNANGANKGKGFKVSRVANGNGEGAKNGVRSISLKRREADGSVIAEFARPLNGREGHNMADLSGCTTFFLVTQWIQYEPGAERNELPMSATVRRNVCALAEKCSLDVREVNGQNVKEEDGKKLDSAINSGPQRDNGIGGENSENPEVGQSVDISGKGDPCSFAGTNYALRWTYNRATDSVEFVMKQKPKKGKWWSAVGIGDNMSDMDIGIIFLEDGTPKEMADYFSSSYDVPDKDKTQDWKLDKKASKWDENEVELHFARKLVTEDAEKDRSLDGCVLFQFAANAGRYGPGNRIHKHEDWPDLYKACDLKKRCIRQKRQSSNEEENLPIISHSTDEKGEGNQKQQQNGQTEGSPNSSGDKVINLLMKSLGPQIVKTVSESESAISNSTSGPIEEEKASPTGAATIFSIIEEGGEEEGNYTQQNGRQNGQGEKTEGDEGGNSAEEGKGGKSELKPIGEKRQEQNGDEGVAMQTTQNAETAPSTTAPLASIATSPLAGEEEGEAGTGEQTYSTLGATSTIAAPAIPGNVPQQNTGSPFSLNAFLGGEQTSPENLVPVGEPGPNGTTKGPEIQTPSNGQGGGEIGPSTSVVRISGEAASAEKGETTPPAGGGGFGINQMFGGEGGGGSTNSGREEAVEGGNDGSQNNQTTNASSIGPSEGSTLGGGSSTLVPGPTSSGEESQEGHPAEEGPQMIGSTQLPPFNNSLPPSPANPLGSSLSSSPPNESSSTEEIANEAAGTTYGVPNTTAAASEGIQSSTGGFELIASGGPEGEGTSTFAASTTLPTIGPSSSPFPPSTPIPSSSPAPISTGLSPNGTTANDENELYSTPTTKSSPTESPSSSISTVRPSSTGAPQNRMSIEGENSNGLEDGGNELPSPTPSQANGGNNGTSAAGENVGNGNALEKPNGPTAPQTGSGELEERGIKLPVATSKCDALRPDLPICQSYMGAYMERVKDWAERHGEPMSNQYPKACKLLSAVPHVPTLCCQIFAEKCADYI